MVLKYNKRHEGGRAERAGRRMRARPPATEISSLRVNRLIDIPIVRRAIAKCQQLRLSRSGSGY